MRAAALLALVLLLAPLADATSTQTRRYVWGGDALLVDVLTGGPGVGGNSFFTPSWAERVRVEASDASGHPVTLTVCQDLDRDGVCRASRDLVATGCGAVEIPRLSGLTPTPPVLAFVLSSTTDLVYGPQGCPFSAPTTGTLTATFT